MSSKEIPKTPPLKIYIDGKGDIEDNTRQIITDEVKIKRDGYYGVQIKPSKSKDGDTTNPPKIKKGKTKSGSNYTISDLEGAKINLLPPFPEEEGEQKSPPGANLFEALVKTQNIQVKEIKYIKIERKLQTEATDDLISIKCNDVLFVFATSKMQLLSIKKGNEFIYRSKWKNGRSKIQDSDIFSGFEENSQIKPQIALALLDTIAGKDQVTPYDIWALKQIVDQFPSITNESIASDLQLRLNEILGKWANAKDQQRPNKPNTQNNDGEQQPIVFVGLSEKISTKEKGDQQEPNRILHQLIQGYRSAGQQAEKLARAGESDADNPEPGGIQQTIKRQLELLELQNLDVRSDSQNPKEYLITLTQGQIEKLTNLLDLNGQNPSFLKHTLEQLKTEGTKFSLRLIPIKDTQKESEGEGEGEQKPTHVLAVDYQMNGQTIRFELEQEQSEDDKKSFELRSVYTIKGKENEDKKQTELSEDDISSIISIASDDEKFVLLDAIAKLAIENTTSGDRDTKRKKFSDLYSKLKQAIESNRGSFDNLDSDKYIWLQMILNEKESKPTESVVEETQGAEAEPEPEAGSSAETPQLTDEQESFIRSIFSYEINERGSEETTNLALFDNLNDLLEEDGSINLEELKTGLNNIRKEKPAIWVWEAWANSHPSLAFYLTQEGVDIENLTLPQNTGGGESQEQTMTLSLRIGEQTYQITYDENGRVSKITEGSQKEQEITTITDDTPTLLYSALLDKDPNSIEQMDIFLGYKSPEYKLTIAQILSFHAENLLSQDIDNPNNLGKIYTINLIQEILAFKPEELTEGQQKQLQEAQLALINIFARHAEDLLSLSQDQDPYGITKQSAITTIFKILNTQYDALGDEIINKFLQLDISASNIINPVSDRRKFQIPKGIFQQRDVKRISEIPPLIDYLIRLGLARILSTENQTLQPGSIEINQNTGEINILDNENEPNLPQELLRMMKLKVDYDEDTESSEIVIEIESENVSPEYIKILLEASQKEPNITIRIPFSRNNIFSLLMNQEQSESKNRNSILFHENIIGMTLLLSNFASDGEYIDLSIVTQLKQEFLETTIAQKFTELFEGYWKKKRSQYTDYEFIGDQNLIKSYSQGQPEETNEEFTKRGMQGSVKFFTDSGKAISVKTLHKSNRNDRVNELIIEYLTILYAKTQTDRYKFVTAGQLVPQITLGKDQTGDYFLIEPKYSKADLNLDVDKWIKIQQRLYKAQYEFYKIGIQLTDIKAKDLFIDEAHTGKYVLIDWGLHGIPYISDGTIKRAYIFTLSRSLVDEGAYIPFPDIIGENDEDNKQFMELFMKYFFIDEYIFALFGGEVPFDTPNGIEIKEISKKSVQAVIINPTKLKEAVKNKVPYARNLRDSSENARKLLLEMINIAASQNKINLHVTMEQNKQGMAIIRWELTDEDSDSGTSLASLTLNIKNIEKPIIEITTDGASSEYQHSLTGLKELAKQQAGEPTAPEGAEGKGVQEEAAAEEGQEQQQIIQLFQSIFSYQQQKLNENNENKETTTVNLFEDLNDVLEDGQIKLQELKTGLNNIRKEKPAIWEAWANSHPSLAFYLTQEGVDIENLTLPQNTGGGESQEQTMTLSLRIGEQTYQITYDENGRVSKITEGSQKEQEITTITDDTPTLLYSALLDKDPNSIKQIDIFLGHKSLEYKLTIAQILSFHAENLLSQDIDNPNNLGKIYTINLIQQILAFKPEGLSDEQQTQLRTAQFELAKTFTSNAENLLENYPLQAIPTIQSILDLKPEGLTDKKHKKQLLEAQLALVNIFARNAEDPLSLSQDQDPYGIIKKSAITTIQQILAFKPEELSDEQKEQLQSNKDSLQQLLEQTAKQEEGRQPAGQQAENLAEAERADAESQSSAETPQLTEKQPSSEAPVEDEQTQPNDRTEKMDIIYRSRPLLQEELENYQKVLKALEHINEEEALEIAINILSEVASYPSLTQLSTLIASLPKNLRKNLLRNEQFSSEGTISERRLYSLLRTKGKPSKLTEIEQALFWEETEVTKPEIPQTLEALILLFNEGEHDKTANISLKISQLTPNQKAILKNLDFEEHEGSLRPTATTASTIRNSDLPDDIKRALLGHRKIPRRNQLGTKLRQKPGNYDKELLITLLIKYHNLTPRHQIPQNIRKFIANDPDLKDLLEETTSHQLETPPNFQTISIATKKGKSIIIIIYPEETEKLAILRTFSQNKKFRKSVALEKIIPIEELPEEPIITIEDLTSLFEAKDEQDRNKIKDQIQYGLFAKILSQGTPPEDIPITITKYFYGELLRYIKNQRLVIDKEESEILSQVEKEILAKSKQLQNELINFSYIFNNIPEEIKFQVEGYKTLFAVQALLRQENTEISYNEDANIDTIANIFGLDEDMKRRLAELTNPDADSIFRIETLKKKDLDIDNLLETKQYSYPELILASKIFFDKRNDNVINKNIVELFLELAKNRAKELQESDKQPSKLPNYPLLGLREAQEIAINLITNTNTFWTRNISDLKNLVILNLEQTGYSLSTFASEDITQIARLVKILSIRKNANPINLNDLLKIYSDQDYSDELHELTSQTIYYEIKRQAREELLEIKRQEANEEYRTQLLLLQHNIEQIPFSKDLPDSEWMQSEVRASIIQGTFDPVQESTIILQKIKKLNIKPVLKEELIESAINTPLTIHFDPENPSNNITIDISNKEKFISSYIVALQKIKRQKNQQTLQNLHRKIELKKMAQLLQEIGFEQYAKLFEAPRIELSKIPQPAQRSKSALQLHLALFYPGQEATALLQELYRTKNSTSPVFSIATEVIKNILQNTRTQQENTQPTQMEINLINIIRETLNPSLFQSSYVQKNLIPNLRKALRLNGQIFDNIDLQDTDTQTYIRSNLDILAQAILNLRKQNQDENLDITRILEESIRLAIQDTNELSDGELEVILDLFQEQDLPNTINTNQIISQFIKRYKQKIIEIFKSRKQKPTRKQEGRLKDIIKIPMRRKSAQPENAKQFRPNELLDYLRQKNKRQQESIPLYKRSKAELELLLLSYAITDPNGLPLLDISERTIETLYNQIQRTHYLELLEKKLTNPTENQDNQDDDLTKLTEALREVINNSTTVDRNRPQRKTYPINKRAEQGIFIPIDNKNKQIIYERFRKVKPDRRVEPTPIGIFLTYNPNERKYQIYFVYKSDKREYLIEQTLNLAENNTRPKRKREQPQNRKKETAPTPKRRTHLDNEAGNPPPF